MKKVLLVCLLLTGCSDKWFAEQRAKNHAIQDEVRQEEINRVQDQLKNSQHLKDCVVEFIGNDKVIRCPNSQTSTEGRCGKLCTNQTLVAS